LSTALALAWGLRNQSQGFKPWLGGQKMLLVRK
jgi:hypothetical protein